MSDERPVFIDTNVLVYCFDRGDTAKQAVAKSLISDLASSGLMRLSTQVLQEFVVTVTRKITTPLGTDEAMQIIDTLSAWELVTIELEEIKDAARLVEANRISFWDGLIIAAALRCGAQTIMTEDLNHGQRIEGVQIVNPFVELAASVNDG